MLTKDKVYKSLEDLPDKFSLDELLDKLILLQKIETGLEQSDSGQTISDDDLERKLGKWLS
jgi:hypothetical protein